jgi:hypothetical protein
MLIVRPQRAAKKKKKNKAHAGIRTVVTGGERVESFERLALLIVHLPVCYHAFRRAKTRVITAGATIERRLRCGIPGRFIIGFIRVLWFADGELHSATVACCGDSTWFGTGKSEENDEELTEKYRRIRTEN